MIFIQLLQQGPPLFLQLPLAELAARGVPVSLWTEGQWEGGISREAPQQGHSQSCAAQKPQIPVWDWQRLQDDPIPLWPVPEHTWSCSQQLPLPEPSLGGEQSLQNLFQAVSSWEICAWTRISVWPFPSHCPSLFLSCPSLVPHRILVNPEGKKGSINVEHFKVQIPFEELENHGMI